MTMKRSLHQNATAAELGVNLRAVLPLPKIENRHMMRASRAAALSFRQNGLDLAVCREHLVCSKTGNVRIFRKKTEAVRDRVHVSSEELQKQFRDLMPDLKETGCASDSGPYMALTAPSLLRRAALVTAAGREQIRPGRIISATQAALTSLVHYRVIPMDAEDNIVLVLDYHAGMIEATFANVSGDLIEVITTVGGKCDAASPKDSFRRLLSKLPLSQYPSTDPNLQCYYARDEMPLDLVSWLYQEMNTRFRFRGELVFYPREEICRGAAIRYALSKGLIQSCPLLDSATFRLSALRNEKAGGGYQEITEPQFSFPYRTHMKAVPGEYADNRGRINFLFQDEALDNETIRLPVPIYEIWDGKDLTEPLVITLKVDADYTITLTIENKSNGKSVRLSGNELLARLTEENGLKE